MVNTTIKITQETMEKLKKLKIIERESYESVILKLMEKNK